MYQGLILFIIEYYIAYVEKNFTVWGLQVKFYLGENEDYSPGENISDSSEKLLQGKQRSQDI